MSQQWGPPGQGQGYGPPPPPHGYPPGYGYGPPPPPPPPPPNRMSGAQAALLIFAGLVLLFVVLPVASCVGCGACTAIVGGSVPPARTVR